MTSFTPFSLGNYLCQNIMSTGGSGDLFQATHLPSNGRRAIRLLGPSVIDNPDALETILQTLFRLKTISHPNIITVHEIIRREYQIFIIMDFIEGFSLKEILAQIGTSGPFTTQVASFITWQICQALYYAHNLNEGGRPSPILHGALWPSNVLVSLNGEVRLTDFNNWVVPINAYNLNDAALNRQLSYRSPEHLLQGNLTHSSDLFCIGVLFYQMLTGQPLFQDAAAVETIERVKGADLRHALDSIPANLQPILRRCLAQDPHQRFTDVAAFLSELALEVLGVGGQRVREDLVSFLRTHMILDEEEETDSLPRSAPLPGSREDEITSINPADMTNLLVALSRERTDTQLPAPSLPLLDHPGDSTEEIESLEVDRSQIEGEDNVDEDFASMEIENEATVVDSQILPSLVHSANLEGNPLEVDDTSVTEVKDALLKEIDAESSSHGERPLPAALFPPLEQKRFTGELSVPLREIPTDTITSRADRPLNLRQWVPEEGWPEIPAPGSISPAGEDPSDDDPGIAFRQDDLSPAAHNKKRSSPFDSDQFDDLTPLPIYSAKPAPSTDLFNSALPAPASLPDSPPRESYSSEEVTAGSPLTGKQLSLTAQNLGLGPTPNHASPPPPAWGGLAKTSPPGEATTGTPSTAEVRSGQKARGSTDTLLAMVQDAPLETDEAEAAEALFDSSFSSIDGEDEGESENRAPWERFSAMPKPAPRSNFTAAHLLLIIAIFIFLVAVSLLVRRCFFQAPLPATTADSSRSRQLDGSTPSPPLINAPKPDQLVHQPSQDAAPPAPKPPPKTLSPGSRETGKHLDKLLHGQAQAGQLQIDSTPPGLVFIGGKQLGQTPIVAKPGIGKKVPVVIIAKGFKLYREVVMTSDTKALQINVQLSPAGYARAVKKTRGILNIICHRDDLRQIFIDGQSTGFACPKVGFFLKPGRYKISLYSLTHDRFRAFNVRISRNRRRVLRVPR